MASLVTRTAVITGASRGLGFVLAKELAIRGWNLILTGRNSERLVAARHQICAAGATGQIIAIPGDVADANHRRIVADSARLLGGLQAVVNNASSLGPCPRPDLLFFPVVALEEVFRVNVIAPLALLQDLREHLPDGARILNISSDAGAEPYSGWGGYGASKAALDQWTAILAVERPDWRVYRVDPGDMRTDMHQAAFPDEDISDRPLPDESVPGLVRLLEGDFPSGAYSARVLGEGRG